MVKWPPGDGDDAIVSLFRAFFDQVAAAAWKYNKSHGFH